MVRRTRSSVRCCCALATSQVQWMSSSMRWSAGWCLRKLGSGLCALARSLNAKHSMLRHVLRKSHGSSASVEAVNWPEWMCARDAMFVDCIQMKMSKIMNFYVLDIYLLRFRLDAGGVYRLYRDTHATNIVVACRDVLYAHMRAKPPPALRVRRALTPPVDTKSGVEQSNWGQPCVQYRM